MRSAQIALVAFLGLAAMAEPITALAMEAQVRLALTPIGQPGTFFDLTMQPGDTMLLEIEIGNAGDVPVTARTYAADVYTIINGGFGGRLRDEPQTNTTRWLDYPTEILRLPAGNTTRRSFTITVPADAGAGEYITSIVLENDEPIAGDGAVAFDQIVRHAVGVVVTVPGLRSPALTIGEAIHVVVAGTSVVKVAVANPGNVRLKPLVEFTLLDDAGGQVSESRLQMDSFYAKTDTFVEVPLSTLLVPGWYTVRMALDDAAQDVRTASDKIPLLVEAVAVPAVEVGMLPGLAEVLEGDVDEQIGLALLIVALAVGAAIGTVVIGVLLIGLRGRRRPGTARS